VRLGVQGRGGGFQLELNGALAVVGVRAGRYEMETSKRNNRSGGVKGLLGRLEMGPPTKGGEEDVGTGGSRCVSWCGGSPRTVRKKKSTEEAADLGKAKFRLKNLERKARLHLLNRKGSGGARRRGR